MLWLFCLSFRTLYAYNDIMKRLESEDRGWKGEKNLKVPFSLLD